MSKFHRKYMMVIVRLGNRVTVSMMVEETGRQRQSVWALLCSLQDKGYLTMDQVPTGRKNNIYRIPVPILRQMLA